MPATWTTTTSSAVFADRGCGERVPSKQPQYAHASMSTPANTSISETSASTLVSLFILVSILRSLLLVILLSLSGLTRLASLVGLTTGLDTNALQGD